MSETLASPFVTDWLLRACDAMRDARVDLIELDRAIGDGDHGENMDRGFSAVREQLRDGDAATKSMSELLKSAAMTLMSTVGGAAGPLYGTALLNASRAADGDELDAAGTAELVAAALAGIQKRGKADRGEKTMVDAWGQAADAAREAAEAGASAADVWQAAAEGAAAGAQATVQMKATKGRASYLGERSIGHLDPGAESSRLILAAAAAAAEAAGAIAAEAAGATAAGDATVDAAKDA